MKTIYFSAVVLILSSCASYAGRGFEINFAGKDYHAEIKSICSPCDLVCNNVFFQAVNKKDNSKIKLTGKSLNTSGSMDFRGYIFQSKKFTYTLLEPGVSGYSEDEWGLAIDEKIAAEGYKTILEEPLKITSQHGVCNP